MDEMVVTLGLDARSFKTGVLAAQRAMNDTRESVEKAKAGIIPALGGIGSSVSGLALRFTGLFFAVRGIGDIVSGFKKLSDVLWHLGVDSQNIGTTANKLRTLQEVSKLAGGSIEDATQSALGLQQSLFNLRFKGELSDGLRMLIRMGVQFQAATGKARDLKDVALDLSEQLQAQGYDQATRYQYALSAELPGGLATAVSQGPDKLREYLATASADNKDITDKVVDSQTQLQQSVVSLDFKTANAASVMLNTLTPALHGVTDAIGNLIVALEGGSVLGGAASDVSDWWHGKSRSAIILHAALGLGKAAPTLGETYNNPLDLKATGHQVRGKGGLAVFPDVASGLMAARNQIGLDFSRGDNTIRKLITSWAPPSENDTAGYIDFVARALGKSADAPLSAADYPALMQAMAKRDSGMSIPLSIPPNPRALGAAATAVPTPRAALPAARSSAAAGAPIASNSVQVDSITINTQATDADGIFADARRAVQRKFGLAQADPGVV